MSKKLIEKIKDVLKSSTNVLIVAHKDPDCDAIGSALGISFILDKLGIKNTLYCQNPIPVAYLFLPHSRMFKQNIPQKNVFDLCITVDCSDISRIGSDFSNDYKYIINIDHHLDNSMFGDTNFVEPVAATAQLVYRIAEALKINVDKKIATCLYSALITDTGSFRYANTSSSVFDFAAQLVKCGADPFDIAKSIYENRTISYTKILRKVLNRLQLFYSGKIAWAYIDFKTIKRTGAKPEDLSGIVDFLRSIKGVEVSVFARQEENGNYKINLRSKRQNIQKIAKIFGGGGHPKASGIETSCDIKVLKSNLISAVKNSL